MNTLATNSTLPNGTPVHYHGSLTLAHGTYTADVCTCINCREANGGSGRTPVRYRLSSYSVRRPLLCVSRTSITPVA